MAEISGKGGKVLYGSVVVANITEWSLTGFVEEVTAVATPFAATVKTYIALNVGDPGKIAFAGNYDPADSTGQQMLATLCATGVGTANLYLYANTSTFWRVGAGGTIIVTKAHAVKLPRSGMGTIDFEGQVSGAAMEQVGTGT
jgi:hypothetical protein